jgi:hypothetical protein
VDLGTTKVVARQAVLLDSVVPRQAAVVVVLEVVAEVSAEAVVASADLVAAVAVVVVDVVAKARKTGVAKRPATRSATAAGVSNESRARHLSLCRIQRSMPNSFRSTETTFPSRPTRKAGSV